MESITSIKHPLIIQARELSRSKKRVELNKCLLYSIEQLQWALDAHIIIEAIFISAHHASDSIAELALQKNIPCYKVSEGVSKKITDTNYLVPIIAIANTPATRSCQQEIAIVLDNVVDQGNIGTILRTGTALGITDFATTNPSTDLFFRKTIDASRGTVFRSNLEKFESDQKTVDALKERGFQIIATSPHASQLLATATLDRKPAALFVGNETTGCSNEIIEQADLTVQIPMQSVESLNVAIAAGISIYEINLKMVYIMLINKIHKSLGRQLSASIQLMQEAFNHELQKVSDITAQQLIFLMILACDQTMTKKQVTQDIGIAGDDLDIFLQPLIEKGALQLADNETLKSTGAGNELIAKLWPIHQKTEHRVLEGLSHKEQNQLHAFLSTIQTNCQKITG